MGISEFKAKCIAILKEVQRSRRGLVITNRGQPVARVEPMPERTEKRRLGGLRRLGRIHGDLVETDFPEDWEMEGA